MTETAMNTGTLEYVDPNALMLEENVRPDQALTKQFIASIKENGVLVPILARRAADGTLLVRAGARRTMAAREAGLVWVPVYVTEADDDTAERIVQQITENDHRLGLRQVDRVLGIQMLLDTGLSQTKVAKKLAVSAERVKLSKQVASSQVALDELANNTVITLAEAAVMAEFADDEQALERLRRHVGRSWFEHEAAQLRQAREDRKAFAAAKQRYEALGYEVLDKRPDFFSQDYVPMHVLVDAKGEAVEMSAVEANPQYWTILIDEESVFTDKETGEPVDEEDIDWATEGNPGATPQEGMRHADSVIETTGFVPSEYYCRDLDGAGLKPNPRHAKLSGKAAIGGAVPTPKDDLAEKRERRKVIALNKAAAAAEGVRREFVAKLLARKSPPKGAALFVCRMLAGDGYLLSNFHADEVISELLGIGPTIRGGIGDLLDKGGTTDGRAQVITLGLVLGALEARTPKHAWRNPSSGDFADSKNYLMFLVEQGYTLSEVEKVITGERKADDVYAELSSNG
jgi:ParB family chromosome partitioning protein